MQLASHLARCTRPTRVRSVRTVMLKRWIVERSFAWLEKNRCCLRKNCEHCLNTSLQFVHLVFLVLLIKRF